MRKIARLVRRRGSQSRLRLNLAAEFGGGGAAAGITDIFLGFGGVITGQIFHSGGGLLGVIVCEVSYLLCLGVNDIGGVGEVVVDEFFVGNVD